MTLYRYHITPTAPFATPLRSDTLYGHLLWRAAERHGARQVDELIKGFSAGTPPFVVSSAFPGGCLPVPLLAPLPRRQFAQTFAPAGGRELLNALRDYKQFKKISYIREKKLLELAQGISQQQLFAAWRADKDNFGAPVKETSKTAQQPHNSIDRTGGSVLQQGGLHFTAATWYRPDTQLDLYVETGDVAMFEQLLDDVGRSGFGADSSTGKGHFTFRRDENFATDCWPQQGNARLLLSLVSNENMADFAGYYQPQVKHGRAWSGFGEKNPFKKPFMAITEGAVLTRLPQSGYVLRNIHSNPDIVQITWPLTMNLQLEV